MIAAITSFFGAAVGEVKSNWLLFVIIAALVLALAAAIWRADHLSGELALEQTLHKATKESLALEVEKGLRWKAAYEQTLVAANAHRTAAKACLDRAKAQAMAQEERTAIMQAAQPRPRTEQERQQVVNDATRKIAADRLNRPF
jgi:hypothetical protein